MDWDSNGDISFGEFVYAFTKWVDVDGEDTVEELVSRRPDRVGWLLPTPPTDVLPEHSPKILVVLSRQLR